MRIDVFLVIPFEPVSKTYHPEESRIVLTRWAADTVKREAEKADPELEWHILRFEKELDIGVQ